MSFGNPVKVTVLYAFITVGKKVFGSLLPTGKKVCSLMKRKEIHWLARNYKDLFSGGLVVASCSLVPSVLSVPMTKSRNYPYGYSLSSSVFMILCILMVNIFAIFMTVYNYRYLLKNQLSEPHPKKQAFLLIWESLCLCVNIFLFVFSLI